VELAICATLLWQHSLGVCISNHRRLQFFYLIDLCIPQLQFLRGSKNILRTMYVFFGHQPYYVSVIRCLYKVPFLWNPFLRILLSFNSVCVCVCVCVLDIWQINKELWHRRSQKYIKYSDEIWDFFSTFTRTRMYTHTLIKFHITNFVKFCSAVRVRVYLHADRRTDEKVKS
jgi:hypothetical protein